MKLILPIAFLFLIATAQAFLFRFGCRGRNRRPVYRPLFGLYYNKPSYLALPQVPSSTVQPPPPPPPPPPPSCTFVDGDKGYKGNKGSRGLDGPPGARGATGDPGDDRYHNTNLIPDLAKGRRGDEGDEGLPGEPGSPGPPGLDGYPGECPPCPESEETSSEEIESEEAMPTNMPERNSNPRMLRNSDARLLSEPSNSLVRWSPGLSPPGVVGPPQQWSPPAPWISPGPWNLPQNQGIPPQTLGLPWNPYESGSPQKQWGSQLQYPNPWEAQGPYRLGSLPPQWSPPAPWISPGIWVAPVLHPCSNGCNSTLPHPTTNPSHVSDALPTPGKFNCKNSTTPMPQLQKPKRHRLKIKSRKENTEMIKKRKNMQSHEILWESE